MAANRLVPDAWRDGRTERKGNYWTDGNRLWSYDLCIGTRSADGRQVVFRHTSPNHFESMTTSHHVGAAFGVADDVVDPPKGHYGSRCHGVCEHVVAFERGDA